MNIRTRLTGNIILLLVSGLFAAGLATAQEDEQGDGQKTKKAQAVSKEVYDRIQKAQEQIDAENYPEAMDILNRLDRDSKLTDYERQNVLNYIGFVQYSTDDTKGAIDTYVRMLQIPTIEEQTKKTTMYTLAQLNTMEEKYAEALKLLEEWFTLETHKTSSCMHRTCTRSDVTRTWLSRLRPRFAWPSKKKRKSRKTGTSC
jgi:outer membrane protein assembly factor BamD (BamD/ComL family)